MLLKIGVGIGREAFAELVWVSICCLTGDLHGTIAAEVSERVQDVSELTGREISGLVVSAVDTPLDSD